MKHEVQQGAQVRRPNLRGHQAVAGIWLPADWFDAGERELRILRNWQAGASAYRFEQGDLLCHAQGRQQHCDELDGWPLLRLGGTLCSAQLGKNEASALPRADLWLVQGGEVLALNLRDAEPLDPSHWIALDGMALLDTYDCSAVLETLVLELPPELRDVREVLGKAIPPPSKEQTEFLKALLAKQRKDPQAPRQPVAGKPHGNGSGFAPASLATRLIPVAVFVGLCWLSWLLFNMAGGPVEPKATASGPNGVSAIFLIVSVIIWLLMMFGGRGNHWQVGVKPQGRSPARTARPASKGQAQLPARRKPIGPQRWRDWLARLAVTSQISRLLGRQQAAYMRRMLELFESGKLDEALRHAIPLGKDGESLGQALGTPNARRDLSLSSGRGAAASIHLGDDLQQHLRTLYRKSFEKLDREGRIDEAVFVLAELLASHQEALDYLEKHGRPSQAADLALAWDMPPATIVRFYSAAGNWKQALLVARRDNAYAAALPLLEKKWPEAGAQLRREWAADLAAKGEWLQAVDAIWPIEAAREQAREWLLAAETAGGGLAAGALVKRIALMPDSFDDCAEQLKALRDDPKRHQERTATAMAILRLHGNYPLSIPRLVRLMGNAWLGDQASGVGTLERAQLQQLIALSADKALQADLPAGVGLPGAAAVKLAARTSPLVCPTPDAGSAAIFDAVPLADGDYLLAHGEAGAAVVDRYGKRRIHFAVPAYQLVLAQSGQLVLALAKRDDVWRVSRLDLVTRRADDLGVLAFDHCADTFDGTGWTIATGNTIRVLDINRSLQTVLWQVSDLPGKVAHMSATPHLEQFLVGEPDGLALWRYHLPQRRLNGRGPAFEAGCLQEAQPFLNPNGGMIQCQLFADASPDYALLHFSDSARIAKDVKLPPPSGNFRWFVRLGPQWLLACIESAETLPIRLIDIASGKICAQIDWRQSSEISARCANGHWLLFDKQGRLLDIDTANSAVNAISAR
ncbi:hypothetical protein FNU76_12005 [Chitinimonas arctica]|uniref:MoxR-vWA-beta-propeller ternary system domain-containing protein n=1 Tax=Chitinimonas arctica TaxID=2594795 RepID=A0A516SFT3_9NEIS|nr:bpX6 domain-containing protein [Chitinimonas arctica]QDQ27025.1 hypothetical protein FNU76_12005 [Chitinimonas arctica]